MYRFFFKDAHTSVDGPTVDVCILVVKRTQGAKKRVHEVRRVKWWRRYRWKGGSRGGIGPNAL